MLTFGTHISQTLRRHCLTAITVSSIHIDVYLDSEVGILGWRDDNGLNLQYKESDARD